MQCDFHIVGRREWAQDMAFYPKSEYSHAERIGETRPFMRLVDLWWMQGGDGGAAAMDERCLVRPQR